MGRLTFILELVHAFNDFQRDNDSHTRAELSDGATKVRVINEDDTHVIHTFEEFEQIVGNL